jgi:hypothetical protein
MATMRCSIRLVGQSPLREVKASILQRVNAVLEGRRGNLPSFFSEFLKLDQIQHQIQQNLNARK